ncbi:MAG: hypothetical protein WDN08_06975 [Rhizomicrobium sp.]
MSLRWLARVYAYATEAPGRAAGSDAVYGALLLAGLFVLDLSGRLSMNGTAIVLLVAAIGSLVIFDRSYLVKQFAPSSAGGSAPMRRCGAI